MTLRVRLFGALAERAGARELHIDVEGVVTVGELIAKLSRRLPDAAAIVERSQVAVNLEIASDGLPISDGDEIAVLPPVAGGADDDPRVLVDVRDADLPVDEVLSAVSSDAAGATVLFLGTVRNHSEWFSAVERLEYSSYGEMATATMRTIAEEVIQRWPAVRGVAMVHAVGDLPVGAHTVAVACSAPHRQEAFQACRYALEAVKDRVPVWKREVAADGARWVGVDDEQR
ncbi:MAG: molybdenum cofactor biosynthesis protein MoaE [Actinobacteria bacterium]|nr:molybdenum cofactor biosynthesis protein MoaE [Actinomycetota bacterium]